MSNLTDYITTMSARPRGQLHGDYKNKADPYQIEKSRRRVASRLQAGRWDGIGDPGNRAPTVKVETTYVQVASIADTHANEELAAHKAEQLAKRREHDRARRAAKKAAETC